MKNRIFALLICMAVLVSAIGCGGSQKSDDSASKAEAVAEEAVVEEAPESPAEEAVPEEKQEQKTRNITGIIITVITAAALIFVIYVMICSSGGKAVNVFGKSILRVVTGSMEPSLQVGDYIVIEKTSADALREGDIISFYSEQSDINGMLVTHRIVGINDDGSFVTRGDANPVSDSVTVRSEKIVGRYTHKSRFFIWVNSFVDLKKLIILAVVIAMTFISLYEVKTVLRISRKVIEERRQEAEEKHNEAMRQAIEKEKLRLEAEGYDPEKEVNMSESRETDEKEND